MNKENLERMGARELEAYAQVMGISTKEERGAEGKREIIRSRRERRATVTVLGLEVEVPVKRLRDKRVVELINSGTDDGLENGMRLLLGDAQYERIAAACVEDDGTVDVDAMAYAVIAITGDSDLKNF